MSRVNITNDGYLEIDTLRNHIYEVSINILICDNNFINNLTEKNWFDEKLFFELIEKLKNHPNYKDFDFTKIIFSAAQKFLINNIISEKDDYDYYIKLISFEYLSNRF